MSVNARPAPAATAAWWRALAAVATAARGLRRESGQALVEFALIVPVLALIAVGILDLGRLFYSYEALANAAREGARYCALHALDPEPGRTNDTRARISNELGGRVTPDLTATFCQPDDPTAPGSPVTVFVSAPFNLITPLMSGIVGNPVVLHASATMPLWTS
jgi:hypothetical protein